MNRSTLSKLALAALALAPLGTTSALAATLTVPSGLHPTIQSAVDAAAPGDVIVVKKGVYDEQVVVEEKSDLHLIGKKGATIDAGGSLAGVILDHCIDVELRGFTVLDSDAFGVQVRNGCANVTVSKIKIRRAVSDGVLVSYSYGTVVTKCDIRDSIEGRGIVVLGASAASLISGNLVKDVPRQGIYVKAPGTTVERNTIEQTGLPGIACVGLPTIEGLVVADNDITQAGASEFGAPGMVLHDVLGATVADNSISKTNGTGIVLISTPSATLIDNKITKVDGHGIELDQIATLIENVVKKSATNGVHLHSPASGSSLQSNSIQKAGGHGIQVWSDFTLFVANKAKNCQGLTLDDRGNLNQYHDNKF